MQKKKNNETNDTARDDELSMYAPQEDKIEDAYAAETKIYRIRRHGHAEESDDGADEDIYTPEDEDMRDDGEDEDSLGEDAFTENEAYFDEAY